MVKLIITWHRPADVAAFDTHYLGVHIPLAEAMPGLVRCEVARLANMDGSASDDYINTELWFDSPEAMSAAFASAEGKLVADDMANLVGTDVSYKLGTVVD